MVVRFPLAVPFSALSVSNSRNRGKLPRLKTSIIPLNVKIAVKMLTKVAYTISNQSAFLQVVIQVGLPMYLLKSNFDLIKALVLLIITNPILNDAAMTPSAIPNGITARKSW